MVLLWRRPVRLETIRGGKTVRLGHDGQESTEETIETSTAAKAS
jgi:hypothetical protein